MENKDTTTTQLTENLFIKEIHKDDKKYYILRNYYTFEEDNRYVQSKKDVFINESIANELLSLLK